MTSTLDTEVYGIEVLVNGSQMSNTAMANLVSGEAESSMHRPDSFRLVFRDQDRTVLEDAAMYLATRVTVSVATTDGTKELVTGEVTAIELDGNPSGRYVTVRGLDPSHRLFAGTNTKAYMQASASDIVQSVLSEAGVSLTRNIDETSHVYSVMTQANMSNWAFIQQLAFLEGYDAYVSQGVFNFVKPAQARSGPEPANAFQMNEPTQLVFQKNVLRLLASISGSGQVSEVHARGWDPKAAQEVTMGTQAKASSSQSVDSKAQPETVAGEFGSPTLTFTDVPLMSQGEASAIAAGISYQVAGSFAEFEAECLGNAVLQAGSAVSLGEAGDPFDGKYVVTSARHSFNPEAGGYRTWLRMGGRADRSLFALGNGSGAAASPLPVIPGVVTGVVTDLKDPENSGRVRVRFPWLDDTYTSDWVRPVQVGASDGFGSFFLPEVGDEVLVAFDHGNPSYPYLVGSLYNGINKSHQFGNDVDEGTGKANNRSIVSRMKHLLWFNDDAQNAGISLKTGGAECSVVLKAAPSPATVTIDSKGNVEIKGAQDVTISADQNMTLKAGQSLSITAMSASIKANAEFKVEAATAELKADGPMEVSGAIVKLGG